MNGGDNSTYTLASGSSDRVATPRGLAPRQKGQGSYTIKSFSKVCTSITLFVVVRRTDGLSTNTVLLSESGLFLSIRFSSATTLRIELYDSNSLNSLLSGTVTGVPAGEFVHACVTINFPMMRGSSYANGIRKLGIVPEASTYTFGPFGVTTLDSLFVGDCPLILMFSRELLAPEVKSLSDNPWQVFAPDSKALWSPAAEASVTLPTLVQPSSTTSAGGWTATGAATLHGAINEVTPSDAEYISVNSASTTELMLAEAAYPGTANQTLAYWASSTQGSTLTVTLKQGATQIMSRTHALTITDTLYTQTLTAPEIALITAGAIQVTLTTS